MKEPADIEDEVFREKLNAARKDLIDLVVWQRQECGTMVQFSILLESVVMDTVRFILHGFETIPMNGCMNYGRIAMFSLLTQTQVGIMLSLN